jgi:hypothetical protein
MKIVGELRQQISCANGSVVVIDGPNRRIDANDPSNIYRLGSDGNILWKVSGRETDVADPFVSVELRDDGLIAWTWSGAVYKIDLEFGVANFLEQRH